MNDYRKAYQKWMNFSNLEPSLKEELASVSAEKEIEDRFYRHLAFGTGGLRGVIGAGTNRINRYVIRRATEGLARYLLKTDADARKKGVAIAYDSRHMSEEFSREVAGVLAQHGIPVYLFEKLRPTPMLSFAVREKGAVAGIVITASHNPPQYNGYKVYGPDGGQIPPATADDIFQEIEGVENELTVPCLPFEEAKAGGLIHLLGEEMDQLYTDHLLSLSLHPRIVSEQGAHLDIVYSPLHGTGNEPLRRVLKAMGFTRVHIVKEQEHPDPDFPTVSAPNPEEKQAFEKAIELGKKVNAQLLLATDPDADRVGIVFKDHSGNYRFLNGNQIGALMLYYLLSQKKAAGQIPQNGVMLKTIVTSDLGKAIASSYGIHTMETLTGFKFIGEKIREFEETGSHQFLFGYEESYGYLIGPFVRDKDAIQAGMLICEMVAYYLSPAGGSMTLDQVLEQIYQTYGYYLEDLVSFTFEGKEGQEKIKTMMEELRRRPLEQIGGTAVTKMEDCLSGIGELPKADVLKFHLKDGGWVAIRPSGTEPKIKFYFSTVAQNQEAAEQKLAACKTDMLRIASQF